ncbi:hypothetical protein KIN20_018685 [Parelaphostrongylus tenuis]|uniref:Uncharacterized protein n=1 Tax=Parelaphostrongylus tenuis TaxID=148309 RepID=A0AAD5MJX9_PARTN|nr:hypothetical protein KIN20_018685 [Parelaphostrongylus tenuis]
MASGSQQIRRDVIGFWNHDFFHAFYRDSTRALKGRIPGGFSGNSGIDTEVVERKRLVQYFSVIKSITWREFSSFHLRSSTLTGEYSYHTSSDDTSLVLVLLLTVSSVETDVDLPAKLFCGSYLISTKLYMLP